MAKTKKKPKEYTQREIKKYGLCKHHLVGYKQLEKLVKTQQRYCIQKDKIIDRLSIDIQNKSEMMDLWMKNRQQWTDKINKDLLAKAENHNKEIKELKDHYEKELEDLNKEYQNCVKINREIGDINKDCIEKNTELLKSHNEITRAYNGLHTIGEMAQDLGIDIKKHNKMLPENSDDFQFDQKHTLLENGKVRHEYKLTPKKKPKKVN
jgi:hypothetical protein